MTNYQIKREVLKDLRRNCVPFENTEYGLFIVGRPVTFKDDYVSMSFPDSKSISNIQFPYERSTFLTKFLGYACVKNSKVTDQRQEISVAQKNRLRLQRPSRLVESIYYEVLGHGDRGGVHAA